MLIDILVFILGLAVGYGGRYTIEKRWPKTGVAIDEVGRKLDPDNKKN